MLNFCVFTEQPENRQAASRQQCCFLPSPMFETGSLSSLQKQDCSTSKALGLL